VDYEDEDQFIIIGAIASKRNNGLLSDIDPAVNQTSVAGLFRLWKSARPWSI